MDANFLTEKTIDTDKLIQHLKNSINSINKNEASILYQIISDFEKNDFSLLSPHEIQYLSSNYSQAAAYLVFRHKFKNFPKLHIDSVIPNHLIIEPVSACNLRCIMCYQIDESFTNDQKFMGNMSLELFKKIIDDAHEIGVKAITLTGRGEPTLHPQLGEMLEHCSGKFYELKMNTNATLLNEKLIHKILKSGITDIVFSVDSHEKKQYESIRVLGIFERVVENVKLFKKIKESYPNSKCSTRISGILVNDEQNADEIKKFWEPYVDNVVLYNAQQRWDTYNNPTDIAGKNPCDYLWGEMNVWYDGTCNPCDVDYKSLLSVGSMVNNNILEIWNGEKYSNLRNLHKNGKRNTCYPCDRCSNW